MNLVSTGEVDKESEDTEAVGQDAHSDLVGVMRYFSPRQFSESLRSACRKAVVLTVDATGIQRYKVSTVFRCQPWCVIMRITAVCVAKHSSVRPSIVGFTCWTFHHGPWTPMIGDYIFSDFGRKFH